VLLYPSGYHACRKARRVSDADGRLPYMSKAQAEDLMAPA